MWLLPGALAGLSTAVAKMLAECCGAGAAGGWVAEAMADPMKDAFKTALGEKDGPEQVRKFARRVAKRVATDLKEAGRGKTEVDLDKIIRRLTASLAGNLNAEFVIRNRVDSARLFNALKASSVNISEPLTQAELELYDLSLRRVSQSLAKIADKLNGFAGVFAGVTLKTLDTIKEESEALRESLGVRPEDDAQFEKEYRIATMNALNQVELLGADIEHDVRCAGLVQAFVMMNLTPQRGKRKSKVAARARNRGNLVSAETAFNQLLRPKSGRLLIRGSAGMGKTTLVKWAAIRATDPLSREAAAGASITKLEAELYRMQRSLKAKGLWQLRIPLVVFLRNYGGEIPAVEEFTRFAGKIAPQPPRWVDRVLRAGQGLVFLDGIDEVPTLHRDRLRNQIKTLVDTYPHNYFVLTTRPQAVRRGWLKMLGFREAEVAPMSIPDRDHFVRSWYAAVAEYAEMSVTKRARMPKIANDLITKLADAPRLTEITANPLFCAVTCALFYDRREVPQNITDLCDQLCRMLHKRERPDGEDWWTKFAPGYVNLGYSQKKFLTGQLAVTVVESDQSTISVDQARGIIQEGLKRIPGADPNDARDVMEGLHERYGLLREASPPKDDRPATLGFLHNTFKEFLAGASLAAEGNTKLLLANIDREPWRRAALFALTSTENVNFKNNFLEAFLELLPDPLPQKWGPEVSGMRDLALFALRCWRFATGCNPRILDRLAGLAPQLLPPREPGDAEWLAAAGNDIVDQLRYTPGLTKIQAAACVRTLRLINTREAKIVLNDYKNDKRDDVLIELSQVFNPLILPEVIAWVRRGILLPEAIAKLIADLNPLSSLIDLQELRLEGTNISNMSLFVKFTDLRILNLTRTKISDLSSLSALTKLEVLRLDSTCVSDLTPLANLLSLRELHLDDTMVTDLSPLAKLIGLKILRINLTSVSDITPLIGLTDLQDLRLEGTGVSDLSLLTGLTGLKILNLARTKISDITPLSKLVELEELHLDSTGVSELTPLANLLSLRELHLDNTAVTDLSPLVGHTDLQDLSIRKTAIKHIYRHHLNHDITIYR